MACRDLLRWHYADPQRGRHWHLARVYIGATGGGPLCAPEKPKHAMPVQLREEHLDDEHRVPVATRREFVGRRRAIQSVLQAFQRGRSVLIHGMATIGKSSLASRVKSRTSRRSVVIVDKYDALAIFDKVLKTLPLRQQRAERKAWRDLVQESPVNLTEALEGWLSEALNEKPILLIIDNLENILETPRPDHSRTTVPILPEYRLMLEAVLKAFGEAQTTSRLLLTSRYDIHLIDDNTRDLTADLVRLPLTPMLPQERARQLRNAERLAGRVGYSKSMNL